MRELLEFAFFIHRQLNQFYEKKVHRLGNDFMVEGGNRSIF